MPLGDLDTGTLVAMAAPFITAVVVAAGAVLARLFGGKDIDAAEAGFPAKED